MPSPDQDNLDVLIRTGLNDPVGIGLASNLLTEAGIPFFAMDESVAARQESGNLLGWWTIRVSRDGVRNSRDFAFCRGNELGLRPGEFFQQTTSHMACEIVLSPVFVNWRPANRSHNAAHVVEVNRSGGF